MVSPFRSDGTARRQCATVSGAALDQARRRKERTYPELAWRSSTVMPGWWFWAVRWGDGGPKSHGSSWLHLRQPRRGLSQTHEEVHHVLLAASVVHPHGLHRCQGFLPLLVGAKVLRGRRWFHASDSRGGGGPLPGRGVSLGTVGCVVCCTIFVTFVASSHQKKNIVCPPVSSFVVYFCSSWFSSVFCFLCFLDCSV